MTLVNTEPGGVAKSPQSVVEFLENSKWALDVAVEMSGPSDVANIKAQIVMADTYARELHLSKDIQEQAREMVRRAEYALNRSIRKGQEAGTIATGTEAKSHAGKVRQLGADYAELNPPKPTPSSFMDRHEWNNTQGGISDLDAEPEQFEQAIEQAKAEGNLSRANVVRKVKGQNADAPVTRQQRADVIADLASRGYSSRQMADQVGVRDDRVRDIAREYGIDIPADRTIGKSRRIDHTAAVESAVTELDNWASSLSVIDFVEVDATEATEWVASLTNSLTELRRFIKQIKETTHV